MDSEADKIQYWQYKLNQKSKNAKHNDPKPKPTKVKTPEKPKKSVSILSHHNFFSSTIQKLKGLLEDNNTHRKPTPILSHSVKYSKDIGMSKSHQYDVFKQIKKGESELRTKSNSVLLLQKSKRADLEIKSKPEKGSPGKRGSRSKSLKFKLDRPKKQFIKAKTFKSFPAGKANKKKSLQNKSTTRRYETVELQNLNQDQKSWKKKLMETMVVHRDSKIEEEQIQQQYVNNFKVWEEYQQKIFNEKQKEAKVLAKYLKGFVSYYSFSKKLNSPQTIHRSTKREVYSNFKSIVKDQQEQLLQLKQRLFNLKNSPNINQSLDVLISKVNDNISNLKSYESAQIQRQIVSSFQIKKQKDDNNVGYSNKNEQKIDVFIVKPNKISGLQQCQPEQLNTDRQHKETTKIIVPSPNLKDQSSLNYSHYERSPLPTHLLPVRDIKAPKELDLSSSLKQESSLLLFDSKFDKLQIMIPLPQNDFKNKQKSNQQEQKQIRKQDYVIQSRLNSSEEDMLLYSSGDKNKSPSFIQILDQSSVSNFQIKKDSPQIIIQQSQEHHEQEQQQDQGPVFQRSSPIRSQIHELNQLQLSLLNRDDNNKDLINSLNEILSTKNIQNDSSDPVQWNVGNQQRTRIFQNIVVQLINQIVNFLQLQPQIKQKLIRHYNNEIVEIIDNSCRDHPEIDILNYNNGVGMDMNMDMGGSVENDEESVTAIMATDQYVLSLADSVVKQAYQYDLVERLGKPLGVPSLFTLKCIRRLTEDQGEGGQGGNQQEGGGNCFDDEEVEGMQEYSQVIDCALFQIFQEKFSPGPDNPYQLIFNRCIYDTLNLLLDEYRPFGGRGMPGICVQALTFTSPTLATLQRKLQTQLKSITNIKMGLLQQKSLDKFDLETMTNRTLLLWKEDVIRYIEREYNYKEQDDTIQRYELMMEIQDDLFAQEILQLQMVLRNKDWN